MTGGLIGHCLPAAGGVGEQRRDHTLDVVRSSASTSGSRPCSRSVSLVTGPIETIRVAAESAGVAARRLQEEAHRRGRGEGDVVGLARAPAARAARAARRASHTAPARPPRRPARAARPGARRAPRARARQRARHRQLGERLDERLGDEALGHDVGAIRRARPARAPCRADRRDPRARERARVAARPPRESLEQRRHRVGAGEADEVVWRRGRAAAPASGSMRITGAWITLAPSSSRRRASPLACARARVTATLTPASGRGGSQASSRRARRPARRS